MDTFAIGSQNKIYPLFSSKSADYTITNVDGIDILLVTTGSGANVVITLPSASANTNRRIKIVKVDSGSKFVECKRAGSDTVRGSATSLYLVMQHEDAEFVAIGTDWVLLGNPLRTVRDLISYAPTTYTQQNTEGYIVASVSRGGTGDVTLTFATGLFLDNIKHTSAISINYYWFRLTSNSANTAYFEIMKHDGTLQDDSFYITAVGKR
jgi:hypothetical protein